MRTAVWWIRRDLRLTDNQALTAALKHAERVIPLFVLDPGLLQSRYVGEKRLAFMLGGLRSLATEIAARGGRLIVRSGSPVQAVADVCAACKAEAVYAERDFSPYAVTRDANVAAALSAPLVLTAGVTIRPPDQVRKDDGTPYTVYTPYSRRWRALPPIVRSEILPAPRELCDEPHLPSAPLPVQPSQPKSTPFPSGEGEAKARLSAFIKGENAPIYTYSEQRNRPDLEGTSGLSPYLRFGMISPRLAALAAYTAIENAPNAAARASADTWLSELIWRDFYFAILHHFPHVRRGAFRSEFDAVAWDKDETLYTTWCAGQTGYPFIDAAMRQLIAIGWMHNRARMAVASFLVKDLLIDWRWGERWFMQMLIDGDPAANNGGWQWSAGTGTDAAPYFRIFNPVAQGQKFDPTGAYVRRWVPELRTVPDNFIHEPWRMARSDQLRAGCIIGRDYPAPIVDHAQARARVLAAYKAVKV
ncbi:MAG TPA: deoxyribodipyrimidine photo-lyase [Chloroflexi bacterium]|nr:deoxyribodipyrimidine photo-lyase [Chloroflexota bacterium]HHW88117.1 deoxyribodipyrimidine photo-lyase [Chloroflexota bacterium]